MVLNLLNIITTNINLVSITTRNFIFTCSLNIASLTEWIMIKKNYEKCIYRDTSNPIALYINCFICLCVLSCTYILQHKIKSMHYIEGPKHMIITLHNSPRRLACTCIINYNLYTDAIHELLCNIAVVLGMTLSPSTFMIFKNIRPLSATASLMTRLFRHLTSHH